MTIGNRRSSDLIRKGKAVRWGGQESAFATGRQLASMWGGLTIVTEICGQRRITSELGRDHHCPCGWD